MGEWDSKERHRWRDNEAMALPGQVRVPSCLHVLVLTQILLSALAAGQESGASPPTTAQEYLQRGEKRAGAHDWKGAFADYNTALQLKPDYAEAYNDRGHAYYWTGDARKAIADFTRAIELRPNYPNAFNNRGAAYMASGHGKCETTDFDQAIKLQPDFRNAYGNRANARLGCDWRRALDDFHRAGMHPERTAALAGGGMLLLVGAGAFALVRLRRRLADDGHRR